MVDDWRSLVYAQGPICGGCRHATCIGAVLARDERPLPVLACQYRAGPMFPNDRCPHLSRLDPPGERGDYGGSVGLTEEPQEIQP